MRDNEVRILVTGDRQWVDPWLVRLVLDGLLARYGERLSVISGMASGADSDAAEWARRNGLTEANGRFYPFPAKWSEYGKAAGPVRNKQMLEEGKPHLVFAFHEDIKSSRGTKDMCTRSLKANIPTYLMARFGQRLTIHDPSPLVAVASDPKIEDNATF